MIEIIEQIERINLAAWAQIKYAHDNGLPIPELEAAPKRGRRGGDLPIVSLDGSVIEELRATAPYAISSAIGFVLGCIIAAAALA